jgi:hypothetical protein
MELPTKIMERKISRLESLAGGKTATAAVEADNHFVKDRNLLSCLFLLSFVAEFRALSK